MTSRSISSLEVNDTPLKLRAEDAEDLAVAASLLQDALLPVRDMTFEQNDSRFVMVVQRFRWETAPSPETVPADGDTLFCERIHCGIRFEGVEAVRSYGLDRRKRGHILNLLTIHASPGQIELAFADDVTIRLAVDRILCHIEDIGEPWPTVFTPSHPDSGDEMGAADGNSGA